MLGERLRVARARARKTMAQLGEEIGVTPQAVKKYEADECMPNSRAFIAICKSLDCSAEWLMDGEPLDFHSTDKAPQGRHAKYWIREAMDDLRENGEIIVIPAKSPATEAGE